MSNENPWALQLDRSTGSLRAKARCARFLSSSFHTTPSYIDWQGHRLSGVVAYPALMASSGVSLSFNPAYFHERRFSLLSISGPWKAKPTVAFGSVGHSDERPLSGIGIQWQLSGD